MNSYITLHDFISIVEDGQTVTIDGTLQGIAFKQEPTGRGEHEILFVSWVYNDKGRCARFNEFGNGEIPFENGEYTLTDSDGQQTRIKL